MNQPPDQPCGRCKAVALVFAAAAVWMILAKLIVWMWQYVGGIHGTP